MKVFSTVAAILALASAEPEPGYYRSSYGYGVAHHPYGASAYRGRTVYGYPSRVHYHHKREAEADAEPGYGYSAGYYYPRSYSSGYAVHQSHPGYARSYQSVHRAGGHYLHKREAEADAEPGYGYSYGHPAVASVSSYSYGGVAHHPYGGSAYRARTVYGYPSRVRYLHKREAEADAEAEPGYGYHAGYYSPRSYSYGYNVHQSHPGYARSYQYRSQAGLGGHYLHKREAEADAEPGYGYRYGYTGRYYQPRSYSFGYNVHQGHPGYARSSVSVHQAGGHYIHKREAEAEPGYGYHSLGYKYGRGYARAFSYVAPTTYGYPSHGYGYGYRSGYYH